MLKQLMIPSSILNAIVFFAMAEFDMMNTASKAYHDIASCWTDIEKQRFVEKMF
jgi:hypothetical protein